MRGAELGIVPGTSLQGEIAFFDEDRGAADDGVVGVVRLGAISEVGGVPAPAAATEMLVAVPTQRPTDGRRTGSDALPRVVAV